METIKLCWQFLNDNSGAIQAIGIVVLVGITVYYAWQTRNILKEQEKSRKITFIERRLEKLYYPVKDFLENLIVLDIDKESGCLIYEFDMEKIDTIVPFIYLAVSNDSKDIIQKFIKKIMEFKQSEDVNIYRDTTFNLIRTEMKQIIKKTVEKDIEELEKQLIKLI